MIMENFDKFLGVYATSGDLQTALSTQALKSPWVALVGEYAHPDYNELNWIALFVEGQLDSVMPKDEATNSWTSFSTLINNDDSVSFKAAYKQPNGTFTYGEKLPFYYDDTLYTGSYTMTEAGSNPVLQLTNGSNITAINTISYIDDTTFNRCLCNLVAVLDFFTTD